MARYRAGRLFNLAIAALGSEHTAAGRRVLKPGHEVEVDDRSLLVPQRHDDAS